MNAEMARRRILRADDAEASMGPRSDERGNKCFLVFGGSLEHASMGPRSDERGNGLLIGAFPWAQGASMGPRSDERGNIRAFFTVELVAGFNGAAFG